jgi:hypothetical protein
VSGRKKRLKLLLERNKGNKIEKGLSICRVEDDAGDEAKSSVCLIGEAEDGGSET